jgi:hypothetical protein
MEWYMNFVDELYIDFCIQESAKFGVNWILARGSSDAKMELFEILGDLANLKREGWPRTARKLVEQHGRARMFLAVGSKVTVTFLRDEYSKFRLHNHVLQASLNSYLLNRLPLFSAAPRQPETVH